MYFLFNITAVFWHVLIKKILGYCVFVLESTGHCSFTQTFNFSSTQK